MKKGIWHKFESRLESPPGYHPSSSGIQPHFLMNTFLTTLCRCIELEYEIRSVEDDPERTHDLILNGKTIGFAIITQFLEKRRITIFELYQDYQRRGHGPRFLRRLEEDWRHEGVRIVEV